MAPFSTKETMHNKTFIRLIVSILLLALLTGCSLFATPEPTDEQAQPNNLPGPTEVPTETNIPDIPTETPIPPTDTPTATHTFTEVPTETPTATFTPTEIPSNTPTEEPPLLVVDRDAVCRSGPGMDYPIVGYQSAGDSPNVIGKSETERVWWVITYEGKGEPCWIVDDIVSLAGNVASLPITEPPPTPAAGSPSLPAGEGLYYFLVAENSGGPFGCGDGLLYLYFGKPRTGDMVADITTALTALFANKHQYYNGLFNPAYATSLRVEDVEATAWEREIYIWLRGEVPRPNDKCHALRMRAQIWETIEIQFPDVQHAVIFVNNALLGDILVTGW